MRRVVHTFALVALVAVSASAQKPDTTKTQPETPVSVLQKFKTALDKSDYAVICRLMAEDDASGPLKPVNYEQKQRSLEGLVNMWRGAPFQYGDVSFQMVENLQQSTVRVSILNLRQEVKFVLLKFGQSWYVFDIEIYFK